MSASVIPPDSLPLPAQEDIDRLLGVANKPKHAANGKNGHATHEPVERLVQTGESFLAAYKPVNYVVDGLLIRGYLYGLTSKPNHGKTTVATAIGVHVANDRPLAGLEVSGGRVLFLYGENSENSRLLLAAALQHYQFDAGAIDIVPVAGKLIDMIDQILRECDQEYALVVVDSSAAYFSYDEENNNTEGGDHARDLRKLTGLKGNPAVLACCHPIKNADRDSLLPRGAGAFLAELDTNLTLWASDGSAELGHNKVRGPVIDVINFAMHPVTLEDYKDSKGRPMTLPVAVPMTEQQFMAATRKTTEADDRLLYQLMHHPDDSMSLWATGCGLDSKTEKYKIQRGLKRLIEEKLVQYKRGKYSLTKEGETEAKKVK